MTTAQIIEHQLADIDGLNQETDVVVRYFNLFNLGEYQQVADLFTPEGSLYPPFEAPIIGTAQIADYLVKEAEGMSVSLLSAKTHSLDNGCLQVDVRGEVTALVFKVNVTWCFILTADKWIESVRVNLVATLEELLKLRPE